jgi:Glyoxalase/Bleomycin resistance protein/Dioxygenase superfamily
MINKIINMTIIKDIMQFAIVSDNADKTTQNICQTLNLGPLKVWDFGYPNIFDTTIGGVSSQWDMKLAFGWIGEMQFEIIEPKAGNSLYKEFLTKNKKPGIQHLLIDMQNIKYEDIKEQLNQAGFPIFNEAKSNVPIKLGPFIIPPLPLSFVRSSATTFGYTNTLEPLKVVMEISKYPPGFQPRQAIRMGVPTYWSPGNQKNFETLPADSLITSVEGFVVLVKDLQITLKEYKKLYGEPVQVSKNEALFQLESNFVKLVQPEQSSHLNNILSAQGEGFKILSIKPRELNTKKNLEIFLNKGFEIINMSESSILFTHLDLPFGLIDSNF